MKTEFSIAYVRARTAGTTIMTSRVLRDDSPIAVRPAYDRAPSTPAAPVPEDHVETAFLCKRDAS